VLGIAHFFEGHRVFGKRPDGSLPLWSWVAFFPLLVYGTAVWYVLRVITREAALHEVADGLVIGRRLSAHEARRQYDNFVDLTPEFAEPRPIRQSAGYRNFPILDGGAPTARELAEMVKSLRPGQTFIHCAQGHGRTGLFALAMLLNSGKARTVEEGLRLLKTVRPGVRLSRAQRDCIEKFAQGFCGGSWKAEDKSPVSQI
jgi:hypothetical protein